MNTTSEAVLSAKSIYSREIKDFWVSQGSTSLLDLITKDQNFDSLDILLEEYDLTDASQITPVLILAPLDTTPDSFLSNLEQQEDMSVLSNNTISNAVTALFVYFLQPITDEEVELLFKDRYLDHYIVR